MPCAAAVYVTARYPSAPLAVKIVRMYASSTEVNHTDNVYVTITLPYNLSEAEPVAALRPVEPFGLQP